MELSRILIRELKDYQMIELREVAQVVGESDVDGQVSPVQFSQVEGGRSLPIVIGLPEAQAIERRLKGVQIKRPQTHDLLMNVLEALGGALESITINDLAEQTYFAILSVRTKDGSLIEIDSRPSDAIALGIEGNVPLYVAEHVLNAAQREDEEDP